MKKIKLVIFLLICCLYNFTSYAQAKVNLSGNVLNDKSKPLLNANVVIRNLSTGNLLTYKNLGDQNLFSFDIFLAKSDSIQISVSLAGYISTERRLYVEPNKKYNLPFTLSENYMVLEEVTIDAPPIYKKGDTTFYNVAKLKKGTEQKLGDILKNLPGFRIDTDGSIFFKSKKIEKIKIAGEELFADDPQLLARSFPIHVIKTIQAIENNNRNALLRGFEKGEEVILNLSIEKSALLKIFGDVTVAAGTKDRYKLNSVSFTLKGKVKAGFISNNNSAGDNIKPWNRYRTAGETLYGFSNRLIATGNMPYVSDFSDSRYINNRTFENRLQVNIPISKVLKTNTELSIISDRTRQSFTDIQNFLSANSFVQRVNESSGLSKFNFFKVSEDLQWQLSKTAVLKIKGHILFDRSSRENLNSFTENGLAYLAKNAVKNKWQSVRLDADATKTFKNRSALNVIASFNRLLLPQTITGTSNSLFRSFPIPDSSFNSLSQPIANLLSDYKSKFSFYQKKGRKVHKYGFTFNLSELEKNSSLSITKQIDLSQVAVLPSFSGKGLYQVAKLFTQYSRVFSPLGIPIALATEVGVARLTFTERNNKISKTQPTFTVEAKYKESLTKVLTLELELSYKQSAPDLAALATEIFPVGFASYRQSLNVFLPTKSLSTGYNLDFSFKDFSRLSNVVRYERRFTNYLNGQNFNILSSVFTDSAISEPTNSLFSNLSYDFPFVPFGIKVKLNNSSSLNESLAFDNIALQTFRFFSMRNSVELVRRLNKKTIFNFRYSNNFSKNLTSENSAGGFLGRTVNSNLALGLEQKLGKTISMNVTGEGVNNTSVGVRKSQGLFVDVELRKEVKAILVVLKLENLANQKDYRVYNSFSALNQSLLTFPLIKRNGLLAVTWSF